MPADGSTKADDKLMETIVKHIHVFPDDFGWVTFY